MIPIVAASEPRLAAGAASRLFRADLLDLRAWGLLSEQEGALVAALAEQLAASPQASQVAGFAMRVIESALAFGRVAESVRDVAWIRSRLPDGGLHSLPAMWSALDVAIGIFAPSARDAAARAIKAVQGASILAQNLPPEEPAAVTAFDPVDTFPDLLWPALDAIAQPAWVVDRSGYFQHVNPAWTEFALGNQGDSCLPASVVGTPWASGISGPDRPHWMRVARLVLDGVQPGHAELIACHAPESPRFLEICASPLTLSSQIVGVLWISYDLTALLREHAAQVDNAQVASRLQGVLLAARSTQHHVNNALAIATGYTELVAVDPRVTADLSAMAQDALTGLQRAAGYLNSLANESEVRTIPGPVGDMLAPPASL